jgi:protein-tyrosine kinase
MTIHNDSKKIGRMAEISSWTSAELDERKIIYPGMSNSTILNTFREIRTKLVQAADKKNFVLMVTSVCNKGGSSFIAMNMAAVFALDPTKTSLLIDCNLYQPTAHNLLGVQPDFGLTDYLVKSELDVDDIIYASGVNRLRIIPVGEHIEGGAEHFTTDRMQKFVSSIRERYPDRFIIIDAPPVGLSAEGRILAELSDYSLLVVPYGKVTDQQINEGLNAAGKNKVAGIIYNN